MRTKDITPQNRFTTGDFSADDFGMEHISQFFNQSGDHPFHPHIHNFYQIVWFVKGAGKHYVDFHEYLVEENLLFFVSPGQIHWFDENAKFEGLIIHFDGSLFSDEWKNDNVFLKYNIFNAFDAKPCFKVCDTCAKYLKNIAEAIQDEIPNSENFAHAEYLRYLIKLFLIQVQRMGTRDDKVELQPSNNVHCNYVKFRQIVDNHYRDMHTTKDYACYMNITAKTLYNNVMEVAHITPLQMIDNRIILEAKRMLRNTSSKVKEIAYYLGFEDSSYFVKFFKRHVGCLPMAFRAKDTNEVLSRDEGV